MCINAAIYTRVLAESEEIGRAHVHAACFSCELMRYNIEVSTAKVEWQSKYLDSILHEF